MVHRVRLASESEWHIARI